jgi:hypothetical protein
MKAVLKRDAVLEPELRELCGELDAIQRAKTAEKFMRWANQLTESVVLMDPHLIPRLAPPKVPRGFFLLNLTKWEQDELKAVARAFGTELRHLLRWGVAHVKVELEEKRRLARIAGVAPTECWRFIGANPNN